MSVFLYVFKSRPSFAGAVFRKINIGSGPSVRGRFRCDGSRDDVCAVSEHSGVESLDGGEVNVARVAGGADVIDGLA